MKKIVEIISKNAYPITLTKGDEAILIGFNRETGKYGIAYYKKGEKKPLKRENELTSEEMEERLAKSNFEKEIEEYTLRMQQKEEEYSSLKQALLDRLDSMKLSQEEKEYFISIIERLTVVPEYTREEDRRVSISSKQDGEYSLNEYLRVGNEYDRTQPIALQFIARTKSNTDANTLYRAISVEEMVKRIRDSRVPDREPGE